jgi:hypothetical protein
MFRRPSAAVATSREGHRSLTMPYTTPRRRLSSITRAGPAARALAQKIARITVR